MAFINILWPPVSIVVADLAPIKILMRFFGLLVRMMVTRQNSMGGRRSVGKGHQQAYTVGLLTNRFPYHRQSDQHAKGDA